MPDESIRIVRGVEFKQEDSRLVWGRVDLLTFAWQRFHWDYRSTMCFWSRP